MYKSECMDFTKWEMLISMSRAQLLKCYLYVLNEIVNVLIFCVNNKSYVAQSLMISCASMFTSYLGHIPF